MLRFKGSEFWADIAQVDGAWAPGRSQLVFLRRMSVEFSVDPISAFSRRRAGLSTRRLIRTSSSNGNTAFQLFKRHGCYVALGWAYMGS